MLPWLVQEYGNPSSSYQPGRLAKKAIEDARGTIADELNCGSGNIIFTSGATESINSALLSAFYAGRKSGSNHILTTSVEHSATISVCRFLEKYHGAEVTYLPVSEKGELDLAEMQKSLRPETCIVSIIWGNNETGVIFQAEKSPSHGEWARH